METTTHAGLPDDVDVPARIEISADAFGSSIELTVSIQEGNVHVNTIISNNVVELGYMNGIPTTPKKRRLSGKQKTFVAEYIANGKNATQAALKAYPNQTKGAASTQGYENLNKPAIQEAIENALAKHEMTPDFAVRKIGNIADMELTHQSAPSILKASNTILELHGWRKEDKPNMTLNINQFFGKSRTKQKPIIDQE